LDVLDGDDEEDKKEVMVGTKDLSSSSLGGIPLLDDPNV